MEKMDWLKPENEKLFCAKEFRRRWLVAFPFHEKALVVIRMQRMAVPILRASGRKVRV